MWLLSAGQSAQSEGVHYDELYVHNRSTYGDGLVSQASPHTAQSHHRPVSRVADTPPTLLSSRAPRAMHRARHTSVHASCLLLATRFWPLTARCSLTGHREPAAQPSLQRAPTAASPAAEQGGVTAPVAQEGRKRRLSLLRTLCSNQLRKYIVK